MFEVDLEAGVLGQETGDLAPDQRQVATHPQRDLITATVAMPQQAHHAGHPGRDPGQMDAELTVPFVLVLSEPVLLLANRIPLPVKTGQNGRHLL